MTASVAIIMGSQSDWETMRHAAVTLTALGVAHEARIVSAHRTPDRMFAYAEAAAGRGLGAGGGAGSGEDKARPRPHPQTRGDPG